MISSSAKLDPSIELETLKSIGPMWSSWKSWREFNSDNVVCHDYSKCNDLLRRAFQAVCNFYIPSKHFAALNRPNGVKLYEGDYTSEVDELEDIIAMHLSSANSDIVLLYGFDLTIPVQIQDRFEKHKIVNRLGMIRSVIRANADVQWVMINHSDNFDKAFQNISNLTCDNLNNVVKLLI